MLNFKDKQDLDEKISLFNGKKISLNEIENFYIKLKDCFKIGVEYERLSLDSLTFKTAGYENIAKIIEHFSSVNNWDLMYDNDCIIGAYDYYGNSISLEPGLQIEISLAPTPYLSDIKNNLVKIATCLDNIAKIYNVVFIGYGINPLDSVEEIKILNKTRYKIMDKYLPYAYEGDLAQKMMRKTAGIQVNIDYFDNFDLYNKLLIANKIMPFVQALSANSPFENNKITEYKSQRAYIWHHTGAQRCNFFYKGMFKNPFSMLNPTKAYIKEILKVPMIYIEKLEQNIPVNGKMNFCEYMKSKNGYFNFQADLNDYILHQSLCFPDVRLKQYIEIRNHDSSDINMAIALCALYKGIFVENCAKIKHLFNDIKINELERYSLDAAKYGLDFKINNKKNALDIAKLLLKIANENLNSRERVFLKPIEEIVNKNETQSDRIIKAKPKNVRELFKTSANIN